MSSSDEHQEQKKAVVLLSGGLDSATVLAIAVAEGFECHTLAVNYGQRHKAELDAARRVSQMFGAKQHREVKIDLRAIGGSALTDDIAVPDADIDSDEIPITYVPARNSVLLSLALGYAEVQQANAIFIGVTAVDYSGYPDCRPTFIAAFEAMAQVATKAGVEGQRLIVHTPLIDLSKADIIRRGMELGVDYSVTVSCYQADTEGHACGRCDSCELRKQGFVAAGVDDQTRYFFNATATS